MGKQSQKKTVTSFHPDILCTCPPLSLPSPLPSFPSLPVAPFPISTSPLPHSASPLPRLPLPVAPLPVSPFPLPSSPSPLSPPHLPLPTPPPSCLPSTPPYSPPCSRPLPSDHYLHLKKKIPAPQSRHASTIIEFLLSYSSKIPLEANDT